MIVTKSFNIEVLTARLSDQDVLKWSGKVLIWEEEYQKITKNLDTIGFSYFNGCKRTTYNANYLRAYSGLICLTQKNGTQFRVFNVRDLTELKSA